MTFAVTVLHNVLGPDQTFMGYSPGDPLVKVAEITAHAADLPCACEEVFRLLNVGDDPDFGVPDPQALAYRDAKNRSLSVGDVLIFDGVGFAVASCGFEKVDVHPDQVTETAAYGSTPLGGIPFEWREP